MATHMDVGDDREPRACPEPGNPWLLVLNLNAVLDDHQVDLGSWMDKRRQVKVGTGMSGSWSEVWHPRVVETLDKRGLGMDGLFLRLRKSSSHGCRRPEGSGAGLCMEVVLTIVQEHHQILATLAGLTSCLIHFPLER